MTDPIKVIAEYGMTMHGDIDAAHRMVDAARAAGASAFKTQLLTPELIATADARPYWRHAKVPTQRDSFTASRSVPYMQWTEVAQHCTEVGLDFVASPFDLYAVEILAGIPGVVFKIASGDLTNVPLLRAVAEVATRPIIVSTGAATEAEIIGAARELRDSQTVWLACTLIYPAPLHTAELRRIKTLRCVIEQLMGSATVGYSDHVGKPASAMGAVFMGATVLEVHTTLTPGDTDCPDDAMALDPEHLADYVRAANTAAVMMGDGKLAPLPEETAARYGASRSIHFARSLPKGHRLSAADLICLRPADGMSPLKWDEVVGAELTRDVHAEEAVVEAVLR